MDTKTTRTVTNRNGKPVISNLRVPWDIGTVLWVHTSPDTVVVTSVEPVKEDVVDDVDPLLTAVRILRAAVEGMCDAQDGPRGKDWSRLEEALRATADYAEKDYAEKDEVENG